MQIYMTKAAAVNGPAEVVSGVNHPFQIGDLVLGIVVVSNAGGSLVVSDQSNIFDAVITESSVTPGLPVLVQHELNMAGQALILLMQRGESIPATASITVGPVDLRT